MVFNENIAATDNTEVETEQIPTRGVSLSVFLEGRVRFFDEQMNEVLALMLKQQPYLAHVEVSMVSPEKEPNTGGYFHRVWINEETCKPSIFIVKKDLEHLHNLLKTRKTSNNRVARLLGIKPEEMTPDLIRMFIIAHELGHAADYVKSYEQNPEYQGGEKDQAAEAWDEHYEANLLMMPVRGYDPVDLREELKKYTTLDGFLDQFPEVKRNIDLGAVKTLDDLIQAQEEAYRSSVYESYADDFAAKFLRRNAQALNISELRSIESRQELAA